MQHTDRIVVHKLKKIAIISLLFMTIEIAGGIMANSIAILADAFHLLSDVFAYSISLYAVLLSKKIAPSYMAFGYEKAQPLGALINVAIIWAVTLGLFIEATSRIIDKSIVEEPLYMLLTSLFGLGCNLFIMRTLHSDQTVPCAHGGHDHEHSHDNKAPKTINKKKQHKHGHDKSQQLSETHQHDHEHKHDHGHDHGHDHDHDHDHDHEPSSQEDQQYEQYKQYIETICSCESAVNIHQQNDYVLGNSTSKSVKNELVEERQLESPLQDIISQSRGYCAIHSNDASDVDEQGKPIKKKKSFENINMQAAYIHILSDIILSIGVIVSASIIFFVAGDATEWTPWQLADPFCTYLFSFVALYSTISIVKESMLILMDGCENKKLIKEAQLFINILRNDHSMIDIQDAKIWSSNRGKHYCTVKIRERKRILSESTESSEQNDSPKKISSTYKDDLTIVYRKIKAFMIQKKLKGFIDTRR